MDSEGYVKHAAEAIGLPIDAALIPAVAMDFERVETFANLVMEFPLDAEVEAAPVFEP